jgi:hypothetical protein
MTESKVPTETIDLPSKGKFYPSTNPLSSGQVELKYMTVFQEDILTNENNLRNGTAIEKCYKSLIVNKDINYDDLLIGDRDQLMLAGRILGYGAEYKFQYYAPGSDTPVWATANLQKLEPKEIDWSLSKQGSSEFDFTLPSGLPVTFKLLTIGDDKAITAEINSVIKYSKDLEKSSSTRLKHIIVAVNGNRDKKVINDVVDKMLIRDSRALRSFMDKVTPGVIFQTDAKLDNGEVLEGLSIPIGIEFFWPRS